MSEANFGELLAGSSPAVCRLAEAAAELVRTTIPDAAEELDRRARLLAFTYKPGTYKYLIAAVALHDNYVNLMFARGAELADVDSSGLLEGTGKLARHVKVDTPEVLADPAVAQLVSVAATRTPRP